MRAGGFICSLCICLLIFSILHATETETTVELWLGGDIHFGNTPSNPLIEISKIVKGTGIVNLEGPVKESGGAFKKDQKWYLFNPETSASFLKEAGVKAASVSNNHDDDNGVEGRKRTEDNLRAKNILSLGGTKKSGVIEIDGLKVAITAFDLSSGIPRDLANILRVARGQGDILVVTFHVTGSPSYIPSKELKHAVDMAIDAGAHVIASHGSHAIGPVERRENSVIAWGLGNLVFNCKCTKEQEGILLKVLINVRIKEKPSITACVLPIKANLMGAPSGLSTNTDEIFDLLEALGSNKLARKKKEACF